MSNQERKTVATIGGAIGILLWGFMGLLLCLPGSLMFAFAYVALPRIIESEGLFSLAFLCILSLGISLILFIITFFINLGSLGKDLKYGVFYQMAFAVSPIINFIAYTSVMSLTK